MPNNFPPFRIDTRSEMTHFPGFSTEYAAGTSCLLERTPGTKISHFPACLECTLGGECHTFSRLSQCATGDESEVFLVGDELNAASQGFSLKTEGNYSHTCFSKRKLMERSYEKECHIFSHFFVLTAQDDRDLKNSLRVCLRSNNPNSYTYWS